MSSDNLIWLDLEMTGLNPEYNTIIEIATIVTDNHLNILAEGPVFAISQPKAELDKMDDWNQKQHGQSGLLSRVEMSQVSMKEAEEKTLSFLKQYVGPGVSPLCGNSVCTDKQFLIRYMPLLANYFHYRLIDVSSLKELARRWSPEVYQGVNKKSTHLALDDIKESIAELHYYRQYFLKV